MFSTEWPVVRSGYSFIPLSFDLSPAASSQVNAGWTRCFLTGHSHWVPCRASWWLHTPACVRPSMQSGRCGRSSGQTYTGHSGADWPGAGNSCGTPEWPNWEGTTHTEKGNITAAPQTCFIDISKTAGRDFKDGQRKTTKRQKTYSQFSWLWAGHSSLLCIQPFGFHSLMEKHQYACD